MIILLLSFTAMLSRTECAIKVVKLTEDYKNLNKLSNATVTNFDLQQLPELTICIRVYFYQFPLESQSDLIWFPLLSSSEKSLFLFSLLAFDNGNKSGDLYQIIPKKIFRSKDLKTYVMVDKEFILVR